MFNLRLDEQNGFLLNASFKAVCPKCNREMVEKHNDFFCECMTDINSTEKHYLDEM